MFVGVALIVLGLVMAATGRWLLSFEFWRARMHARGGRRQRVDVFVGLPFYVGALCVVMGIVLLITE